MIKEGIDIGRGDLLSWWGIIVLEYLRHKVVKKNTCRIHRCVLII